MESSSAHFLFSSVPTLTEKLQNIHDSIIEKVPSIDRIACALYDPKTDLLKTFINSTHQGHAIVSYEFILSESVSLLDLAKTGSCRVISNIKQEIQSGTAHSDWLLEQGYLSSFTIPMMSGDHCLGFIFIDSFEENAFPSLIQRDLLLYSHLMVMTISSEMLAINSLLATAAVARDFTDLRDFETGLHLDRMARFSRLIAKEIAEDYSLSDEFIEHVYLFAPLHDIGKIGIPDAILLKPGKLTSQERIIMETHVEKGVKILTKVLSDYEIAHLSDSLIMLNIIGCHHEFSDGSGYPNKLSGDNIPVEARIVTVADIFDALTSSRPYKTPWTIDQALEELDKMSANGKLDSLCVAALKTKKEEVKLIVSSLKDKF